VAIISFCFVWLCLLACLKIVAQYSNSVVGWMFFVWYILRRRSVLTPSFSSPSSISLRGIANVLFVSNMFSNSG